MSPSKRKARAKTKAQQNRSAPKAGIYQMRHQYTSRRIGTTSVAPNGTITERQQMVQQGAIYE